MILKTKSKDTIDILIKLSKTDNILWDFESDNKSEYLTCKYNITKDKSIDIKITNFRGGKNYFIDFYYQKKKIADYYYQTYSSIFELFIYAKFINYIKHSGDANFIDVLVETINNYEWEIVMESFYSTTIQTSKDFESTIDVWKGGLEITLGNRDLYTIRNNRVFDKLNKIYKKFP